MKTINNIMIHRVIFPVLSILAILFILGCQKDYFARDVGDDNVPLSEMELPVVRTVAVTNVVQSSAQSGGEVTNNGGGTIRSAGIVWAEHSAPTTDDSKNTNGFAKGEYRSNLTKLIHSTTYYVRAYATNDKGTSYGEELSFTTPTPLSPVLTLEFVRETTFVRLGGKVIDNLDAVEERGFVWTLTGTPTIDDNKFVSDASLEDEEYFTEIPFSSLDMAKVYRIRAYAKSPGGISYGEMVFFIATPMLVDIDGNAYTQIAIGDQVWLAENFKATRYRNGDPIPDLLDELSPDYVEIYGQLYEGHSVTDPRNMAPTGWRVATLQDWQKLVATVGGDGGKLKSTTHWDPPNFGATNSTGFNALGSGFSHGGPVSDIGQASFWWTSTLPAVSNEMQFRFTLVNTSTQIIEVPQDSRHFRAAVRLIKE